MLCPSCNSTLQAASRPTCISPSNRVLRVASSTTKSNHSQNNKRRSHSGRTIGYAIRPAVKSEHQTTAILWFYPLGGCSTIVNTAGASFDETEYECSVISVDRPSIGDTDPYLALSTAAEKHTDPFLHRIERHADDVLAVLEHEDITNVYILAVCLGHPYALQVARRLMQKPPPQHGDNVSQEPTSSIELKGITLVAPFVSTACPQSWKVARLGHRVPSLVLRAATNAMASIPIGWLVTEAAVQKIVDGQNEYDWTEDDVADFVEALAITGGHTKDAKATEAQLGSNPVWQSVCDDFAVESGCGLRICNEDDSNGMRNADDDDTCDSAGPLLFPIAVHACQEDTVAPLAAVQWLTKRCLGSTAEVEIHEEIHCHEVMTCLGGPPRSPGLLHAIAREWKLAPAAVAPRVAAPKPA